MQIELNYIIYLDWNVIVDLESGKLSWLEKKIFEAKSRKSISIPFSGEHRKEASNIKSKEEINRRLTYIAELSSNLYFFNNLQSIEYKIETPRSVYNTISEVDLGINPDKFISNLIPFEALKNTRNLLTLDPTRLNNISPEKAIGEIDKIIGSYGEDFSFAGLIKKGIEIAEQNAVLPNKYYFEQIIIIAVFSLLDLFGFWSDKKETYERGSHLVDSRHALNGTFADLVISADWRFCMRSKAVYSLLKRKPKVLHLKTDVNEIVKILDKLNLA